MVNRRNYLWTREYLKHLSEVAQLKDNSIERYRSYLRHLLLWADEVSLSRCPEIRPTFGDYLAKDSLSPSTLKKIVNTSKRLLSWLKANHPREFRTVPQTWIESLRPPRGIQPANNHEYVTLDEVTRLASVEFDQENLVQQRDRAGAVLLFLSGMRVSALGTLPLEAVDIANRTVRQWPSLGVRTKNDKTATTYLLELPDLIGVAERWDSHVRARLPLSAMWFTPIVSELGNQHLSGRAPGRNRHIAIAKRMRKLFAAAGLDYKSPHKFRHGFAVYSLQHCRSMADYKAVSMNLMHGDIRVTDSTYALLAGDEVQQRISRLSEYDPHGPGFSSDLSDFVRNLSDADLPQLMNIIAQRLAN